MANNFYVAILLSGGATGALDAIDGVGLFDLDAAFVQTDGRVYFYSLDATSGATERSPYVIAPDTNPGSKRWVLQEHSDAYIRLIDEKASGTDGGTFTQDAWQKRTVTEDTDTDSNCSVASSVITLQAGKYDYAIKCSAYDVKRHQARLRNTTDGSTVHMGTTNYAADTDNVANYSEISGRFTITAAKNFEIQHYCTQTKATNGWGLGCGTGENEVYLMAEFWKRS